MSRRDIPSGSSDAPSGNSRSSASRNSGSVLDLRETPPIGPTHRWHPEHSVGGWTGRSRAEQRREHLGVAREDSTSCW